MPEIRKPSGPEYQLDLSAAPRREFIAKCNALLAEARKRHLKLCHERGGDEACRHLTDDVDGLFRLIYAWLAQEAKLPDADYARVALVAQGGYGRSALNLHSDVDLLFLMPENPTPTEQAFVRSFLYILWDLNKLDLGHAVKKASEALNAPGLDLDSTTALIVTRLIAGNAAALDDLTRKLTAVLNGPARKWFVESKLAEQRNRHEKFGSSVYLLEPNLKDGEGGLRDIHSLQWLSFVLLGSSDLQALVEKDVLEGAELARLTEGMGFLLSVRTILHDVEGRKQDNLGAERQSAVAKALGYTSDSQLLAEERMLKDYYLHARAISRYAQKATRILTVRARSVLGGMIDAIRRRSVHAHYYTKGGVLFPKAPDGTLFTREPWRVMECFQIAVASGVILSEELKDLLMAAHDATDTEAFRSSPEVRKLFMQILGSGGGTAQAVHAMHETGVLADYMPEFRKLFCMVRIDHYHRYTVDEHLIKTLEVSEDLVNDAPGQRAELVQAARAIGRWDLLNLSLLLHDIGKGEGHGHVLRGAIISQQITQRMGLMPDEQETVRQLILQHLKMVHISQRRDLDDPGVIREMADHVGDVALLRMLYILTYCDTKAVGPSVWTDWKAMLLYDLFRKTQLLLEGKNPIQPASDEQIRRIAGQIEEALGDGADGEQITDFVANAPPKYLASNTPGRMARHLRMLEHLTPDSRVYWEVDEPPGMNYTEITSVSYDRPGFLSFVCGAMSSKDVNILSVQVFSTKDGYAIDTFQVTDLHGNRLPHGFCLDRVMADLNEVLLGRAKVLEKFPIRKSRRAPRPDVAAKKPEQIFVDNEASPNFTVLEVKAYDRPGLLYEITTVCAEQGYYIHLAMITTEAYRVVDVFYLTDLEFNKLEPAQVRKLLAALDTVAA